MIVQRTFKKEYAETLADNVRNGCDLSIYAGETFPYDPDQVVIIPTLRFPEGLKEKMIPDSQFDCDSAIALYEAYSNLTPLQASDKAFWAYLAHVDLFSYMQGRYPDVFQKNFSNGPYVHKHWFIAEEWKKNHPLASFWWIVYFTVDPTTEDKYKYTRMFFSKSAFRANLISYNLVCHKEAVFGYFDFLLKNPEIMSLWFRPRNVFITKHLNKLGGTKLLSSLPREYFTEELQKLKSQILAVTGTKDEEEEEFEERI